MSAVWKYDIEITDQQTVSMPRGAKPLHVAAQFGDSKPSIQMWVLVDPSVPTVGHVVRVAGTGHPLPERPGAHVGTVLMASGSLVWHVFMREAGPVPV